MNGKQLACTLSVLVLCLIAVPAFASEAPQPVPAVQGEAAAPALAPLPAFLNAPAGEECAVVGEDPLLPGEKVQMCGEGCSFEGLNYCAVMCCGAWGACIDTWDGGYCVC